MAQELTVVITGSTGKQGGAVARGLLDRGHKVRAVTRDPNSSQAKSLANAGATLVAASLEDTAACNLLTSPSRPSAWKAITVSVRSTQSALSGLCPENRRMPAALAN